MDFHPLQVVFEAEDPNSEFWKKVMSIENHLAKGLLFGFGRQNSLFGSWAFSRTNEGHRKKAEAFINQTPFIASTDIVPRGKFFFNIPFFRAIQGDKTAKKYGKERVAIERRYRNQDMIEITLKQLLQLE